MKLESAVARILDWSRKTCDKQESLAIAGVHTTLIAVLVACLSAYVVFVFSTVQHAELKAFEEAEKINRIEFLVHHCPYGRIEQAEAFDKVGLLKMMHSITAGIESPSLPRDIDASAQKALGIMSSLVGRYPFKERYFKTEQGRFAARDKGEYISFTGLDEVRAWINSMHETTRVFTPEFLGIGRLLPLLTEFSKSRHVAEEKDAIMKSPLIKALVSSKVVPGFGTHVTVEGLDPVSVYNDFISKIEEVTTIVESTQNHVKRAAALRTAYPSRLMLIILLFIVFVAFGCGVVYPIAVARVRCVFALWLPFLIYVVIGGFAFRVIF